MSLFENDQYRWRETYFILFEEPRRPTIGQIRESLKQLGDDYELVDLRGDDEDRFETLTLYSPRDFAAMDILYVGDEEVVEQVEELRGELRAVSLTKEEREKLAFLPRCTARFDVYHFEQIVDLEDDDEMLDPGGLLLVLERLADLCRGVVYDPQAGNFI